MGSYSSVLSVTTSSREITSKIFFSLKKIRKMSPTNQTFGWGSNSNTNNSNGFGGGYQTNSINSTFDNNNNSTNSSFNNNNNNTCSGGAQQLPNFQDTWGGAGGGSKPGNSSTVWTGSNSIFGEKFLSLVLISFR